MNSHDKNSDFSTEIEEDVFGESANDLAVVANDDPMELVEPAFTTKKNNANVRRRIEDLLEVKRLLKDLGSYTANSNVSAYEDDLFSAFYLKEKILVKKKTRQKA